MTTSFRIGVDWNRDGFLYWDGRPGDALNLIPSPVSHAGLDKSTVSGSTFTKVMAALNY